MSETTNNSPRRKFLKNAAIGGAGAAAMAFPMISSAQTVTLRFQSTWPTKDIFHEYANDYAAKVNAMSGGRLKIEVLPAGSVVKAFDLLDAVSSGTLDGGHGVLAYWYGKSAALALWGSGPAFGMDANTLLSWNQYGGGQQLLNEIYKDLKLDVVSFPYGPMPTQPLGWFKKPIAKVEDMKGLKYRTVGLSIEIFTDMGASVQALPGGDIIPAMDRGLLDAAEFNNASSDRILGSQTSLKSICSKAFTKAQSNLKFFSIKRNMILCQQIYKQFLQLELKRLQPICHGRQSIATPKTLLSCKPKIRSSFMQLQSQFWWLN